MEINSLSNSIECLTKKPNTAPVTNNKLDCNPDDNTCIPDVECSPYPSCNPESNWRFKVKDNKMNCNPDGTLNICDPEHDLSTNNSIPKEKCTPDHWCEPGDDPECNPQTHDCPPKWDYKI